MVRTAEALDAPFLLLPFRPNSDPSGARTFIRNFYKYNAEGSNHYRGAGLHQELRLTEPIVLCSIMKWCWSRMPGGIVTWPVYEGFQIGERESNLARNAFETFIPMVADSSARKNIIFDFYDLLASVAAHGKMNGLGGRKLSRLAGWWAFEHTDDGKGFDGGYRSWSAAADASTHLFFAYLRTLSPEEHPSMSLIERIPRSLQALLASTEYPPVTPTFMQKSTPRVVMLVDAVSPTPFALLRRAKHFEYRDRDRVLRHYSEFEDPVQALTEECKRVLNAISNTNSSVAKSRHGKGAKPEESWSAFQNTGFADLDEKALQNGSRGITTSGSKSQSQGLRSEPRVRDHARPTTPSWADFMSAGFVEDEWNKDSTTLLLPPDKQLPPLHSRAPSNIPEDEDVAPGELAAIATVELDDAFWWVWMTSLAGEEPADRKAVFGRCAVVETSIMSGMWLIMEEQVKGASPDPQEGEYIAKKKGIFSFTKRGKLTRKASSTRGPLASQTALLPVASPTPSKRSLAPDQQTKIKEAAAALKRSDTKTDEPNDRRGRREESHSKTNSVLTIGLQSEAGPAMKWANSYDKGAIRAQYLGDPFAGRGVSSQDLRMMPSPNINGYESSNFATPTARLSPVTPTFPRNVSSRELPALPQDEPPTPQPAPPQPETPLQPQIPAAQPSPDPEVIEQVQESRDLDYSPEPTPASGPNPMDKEIAVDPPRSPHPAYRQNEGGQSAPVPQSPTQNPALVAAQRAMTSSTMNDSSPESVKADQARLKKLPPASGGLKKLFGRKKEVPSRQSVEAARSAGSPGLAPPAEQNFARRLSLMRKKPAPVESTKQIPAELAHPNASELPAEPVVPVSSGSIQDSAASTSHVDPEEHKEAEQEFARFDQGPVIMPAATPQASTPDLVAPQAQRSFNVNQHLASKVTAENQRDSLVQYGHPDEDDTQSEATMEDNQDAITDTKDRWATIRENAARRAAARASEEQSTQSRPSQSVRTDDGETSGEESERTSLTLT